MARLEDLTPTANVRGIKPDQLVTVISVEWHGTDAVELTFKDAAGKVGNQLLFRSNETALEVVQVGRPWSFDADGALFRLVSEAHRIRLAHLFDPVLAVHTSKVDPLPHQITAVYETMLPRQPLRFLLADDPGAGKTIMTGLLIKELIARGDLRRCLIVCPGSLAEQWQDELYQRFQLPFDILTNEGLEAARTGNWFLEKHLVIARLDKLSRNEDVQAKLSVPECAWDLVVCDEAHKMSASFFGNEVSYTKRYRLGQLLGRMTRHLLLLTATPHNGKEEDFQLFMALLDSDRFEGKFRDGVHTTETQDLMRRMLKENLVKFDGRPLFPERFAYTKSYTLSDAEAKLYAEVTAYVREQFNRAEALQNDKRAGTVGFALTVLQRRLASSPEAIYKSLERRRERLESKLREVQLLKRGEVATAMAAGIKLYDDEDLNDLEDAPGDEIEEAEEKVLDQATTAQTIDELKAEISILKDLESLAQGVRRSGTDCKWRELSELLSDIFTPEGIKAGVAEENQPYGQESTPQYTKSRHQKLVIFTEHRDTLNYLQQKISALFGQADAVVVIHGGMGREDRAKAQEAFRNVPEVRVLIATDAAGEGINLQRAHLMINYDLPWNPNRLEQRFGRIHRIGQQEPCHLWNLVAAETREGDVYQTLLEKLEEARKALKGQVFDVLGKLRFDGKPLRQLMIEAIRQNQLPETRAKLQRIIENAVNPKQLQMLIEDKALASETMDISRVQRIREDMERTEARRLQPHYVESFFKEAFKLLGGTLHEREPRRFQINNVPAIIRNRDRQIGVGMAITTKYERIVFEKTLIAPQGQPPAAFVCPGHPLLDATLDLILERNRDLLRRGAVLVDEHDLGDQPRLLLYLDHAIQDATQTQAGGNRYISRRMLYIEMDASGGTRHINYAPYLDYRPLLPGEPEPDAILSRPECAWITADLEVKAKGYAIANVVPKHLDEVKEKRIALVNKTRQAVKERLTKEIIYWDNRANQLKLDEQAGKTNAKLNWKEAQRRADELNGRLQHRLAQLDLESQISALPPNVLGGVVVVPQGLLDKMASKIAAKTTSPADTQISAAKARAAVIEVERNLGFEPIDREREKLGYDIESRDPKTGHLRFIEVKGRVAGADTITVTKNEILYSLNNPDRFILALVQFFDDGRHEVKYLRRPFSKEPDFAVTSVNYGFAELLARASLPS